MISIQTKNFITGFLGVGILILLALLITPEKDIPPIIQNSDQVLGERITEIGGIVFNAPEFTLDDSQIDAKSYIAFDIVTGEVLAVRSPNTPTPIASLTKIMTGYIAVKYDLLNEKIEVSDDMTLNTRPVLGFRTGDIIKGLDLFNSMMIGSANDAALALGKRAEKKLNKPISDIMNEEANALGMFNTRFQNALGFDSETNYSTVADIKQLIQAIDGIKSFSDINRNTAYEFMSENGSIYHIKATNKLIAKYSDIRAIKTGYTEEARGAMANSFLLGDRKVAIVVLNSAHREADTIQIMNSLKDKQASMP